MTASDAGASAEHKLRGGTEPFRIMAPLAAQRASFQEYGLSYARTVVDGKFFDVKNNSGHMSSPFDTVH